MVYLKINLMIFRSSPKSHQMRFSLENLRNLKHEVNKMADLAKHFAERFLFCLGRGKLSYPNTVWWLYGCPKWSERLCLDGRWVEQVRKQFREGV